jgi:hypothetical protein
MLGDISQHKDALPALREEIQAAIGQPDLLPVDLIPGHAPHLPELPSQDASAGHQLVFPALRKGQPGSGSAFRFGAGIAA